MKHSLLIFSLIIMSANKYTIAQSSTDTSSLSDVTVLSNRISIPLSEQNRNVEIISSQQIREWNVTSIAQLLQRVAGIDVVQRGPNGVQADISINGGTFDQTLVLINGYRMSDIQTGHNMMNLPISTSAIERIEILKGPASSIYGINAMNGVINIVTKSGDITMLDGQIQYGTNFQKDDSTGKYYNLLSGDVFFNKSYGKLNNQLGISFARGNGYRYNTAQEQASVYYGAQYKFTNRIESFIQAGLVHNKFGANAFYAAPFDKNAQEQVNVITGTVGMKIDIPKYGIITPSIHYRNGYDYYVFNKFNPSLYQNRHRTHALDFMIDNSVSILRHKVGYGVIYRREQINSTNLGTHNRDNLGAFFNVKGILGDRFDYHLGVYANNNSVFGFKLYPSVDLGYTLNQNSRLYANVGVGHRLPTFTDLYYSDRANVGNPLLTPEKATAYELGYRYQRPSGTILQGSVFYRLSADNIDWFRADTTEKWQPQNLASIRSFGINVNAATTVFRYSLHKLDARLGYAYLKPTYLQSDADIVGSQISKYIINSLAHHFTTSLTYDYDRICTITISNRYARRLNTPQQVDGYRKMDFSILDVGFRYNFKHFATTIDVSNLLNVQYIESGVVPMPGRWYRIGISF